MTNLLIFAAIFVPMMALNYCFVRFMARKSGFRKAPHDVSALGPVLFRQHWGSMRMGRGTAWKNCLTITGFRDCLHLKLTPLMGGGEMLLPLQAAEYEFSQWLRGDLVDITIEGKKYLFGQKIVNMVKQHYL